MKAFPNDFLWGATLTGHQVEGENFESDWWRWEQRPGRIREGATSQHAAEHFVRFEDDVELAGSFGHNALLLSIEWSRIQPDRFTFSDAAIEHYAAVLESLRDRGMRPVCVLHHVTVPFWFAEGFGWHHRAAPKLFEAYVARVMADLGGLCQCWIPVHEPMHWISMVYFERLWPPGSRNPVRAQRGLVNMANAHARVYRLIHSLRPNAQVGVAIRARRFDALDEENVWDLRSSRREEYRCNRLYLDALTGGRWPLGLRRQSELRGTLDFIGVSYYGRETVCFALSQPLRLFTQLVDPEGIPSAPEEYRSHPGTIYAVLNELAEYDLPILVTGNGVATKDDEIRCHYLLDHLAEIRRAMEGGVDIQGYFHRSLLDSFEWTRGYSVRYGLFHVDETTKTRTPNQSAFLYKEFCKSGAVRRGTITQFCPGWEGEARMGES